MRLVPAVFCFAWTGVMVVFSSPPSSRAAYSSAWQVAGNRRHAEALREDLIQQRGHHGDDSKEQQLVHDGSMRGAS
jgi:hypothetical protein